jgi:hypothetical protein
MSMKRMLRLPSEYCPSLLALVALIGCTGQDKDLGSSERSLEGRPQATETEQSPKPSDAGAQEESSTSDETSSDVAPSVNLNPVPEMPSEAEDEDDSASQTDNNAEPNVDETAPTEQAVAEGTEAPPDTEPDANEAQQGNSAGDDSSSDAPVTESEEPTETMPPTDSVESRAEGDAGAGELGPEFGPPRRPYRRTSGNSFSMCSDVNFEEATEPGTVPEQLLGVWSGDLEATALELPSGSGRVTLTLTEGGATVVFGEEVDGSLIPAPWPPYMGPREGFIYTVPFGEVSQDVEFEGEVYPLVVDYILSQNEPLEPHCQTRHPSPVMGEPGCYSCLPGAVSNWQLLQSDDTGICVLDDNYTLPCSELGLCWQDCLCDGESCHYRPGYVNQLRLNAEGQLALPIDYFWLLSDNFTPNAPNGGLWAMLERQL